LYAAVIIWAASIWLEVEMAVSTASGLPIVVITASPRGVSESKRGTLKEMTYVVLIQE
jgi:hypothetical protein